jgi:hypothetical protein
MNAVTSKDGATIAFDWMGEETPVILICSASTSRMANARLVHELGSDLTVFNHDRGGRREVHASPRVRARGRGHRSLIEESGGSANVWGSSSGGCSA